jgi:N-acetylglucosaminyldiphosphoundecaprenol N-acetyl-beta-D-mannosaminyltransferase
MSETSQCSQEHILSTSVSITDYESACDRIIQWAQENRSCYIIAANVHVVMTAYWSKTYHQVVNQAALVTPDGMPLVWALRWLGWPEATRVYGPDLMLACCEQAALAQIPIYLYGGTEEMLQILQENLRLHFPTLEIAGSHSPPFRPLAPEEEEEDIQRLHHSGAKIVFVSLGCPKQEEWMARQQGKLSAVMIGVGAAFGFHSGTVRQAPRWMMTAGLEWLYRLAVEPTRLWKRYFINNPAFILLFCGQIIMHHVRGHGK